MDVHNPVIRDWFGRKYVYVTNQEFGWSLRVIETLRRDVGHKRSEWSVSASVNGLV
jgi:hypothetical protein